MKRGLIRDAGCEGGFSLTECRVPRADENTDQVVEFRKVQPGVDSLWALRCGGVGSHEFQHRLVDLHHDAHGFGVSGQWAGRGAAPFDGDEWHLPAV